MIITRQFKFGCALLAALSTSLSSFADGEGGNKRREKDNGEKSEALEGSLKQIKMGTHWAGPELEGPQSLLGKVVLLKIWGG
jgi:hypothetical protein|tara:strand:- start:2 stop:247 length:246 start_codon:yes stop_codon:yes gene_type:complete